jgi:hypothetical protein
MPELHQIGGQPAQEDPQAIHIGGRFSPIGMCPTHPRDRIP